MPLFFFKSFEDYKVAIWNIEEEEKFFRQAIDLLPVEEEKINSYRFPNRRLEFLTTRYLLQKHFKISSRIEYDANGKPFFFKLDTHLSISHTQKYVAVSVSEKQRVSIDIQAKKKQLEATKNKYIFKSDTLINHPDKYLFVWTAKEVAFKTGCGDSCFFSDYIFHQETTENAMVFFKKNKKSVTVKFLFLADDLLLCHAIF